MECSNPLNKKTSLIKFFTRKGTENKSSYFTNRSGTNQIMTQYNVSKYISVPT